MYFIPYRGNSPQAPPYKADCSTMHLYVCPAEIHTTLEIDITDRN